MKKNLSIQGKKLEINEFGNGESTFLLLSGWTHDFQKDEKFIAELAKQFRVVTISWPGYASSEVNIEAQSMQFLAQIVDEVISQLELEDVYLVGFSMGCQIALCYRSSFDREARLILISPPTSNFLSKAPLYGKIIFSSHLLLSLARAITPVKKFIVNKAYSEVGRVTESSKDKGIFVEDSAQYEGAFDTLVALLTSFIDPLQYESNRGFIFGEKEILQKALDKAGATYKVIGGIGHGAFDTHYKELADAVIGMVKVIR